jgi:hypothetical protein
VALTEVSRGVVANSIHLVVFGLNETVFEPCCYPDRLMVKVRDRAKLVDVFAVLFAELIVLVVTAAVDLPMLGNHQSATLGAVYEQSPALNVCFECRDLRCKVILLAKTSSTVLA